MPRAAGPLPKGNAEPGGRETEGGSGGGEGRKDGEEEGEEKRRSK